MTLTKICGLTTPDTLDAALDGGAAFVGAVVFPKSPRHIPPLHAATLFDRARGRAKVVAVLVDADDARLSEVALILRPDLIQLHGHETPQRAAEARRLTGARIIKALPIRDEADFASVADWADVADHLLFDAKPPKGADLPGGVGVSFDWTLMRNRALPANWFLAGGLSPENLTEAVRISGAPMVDVSSGVESAPGVKDPDLIHAFLKAVSRS
ncbi:phosphoribosylanthranilate isomerase [Brevundimonas naejangsanensis]|uniref:phosphoribosylanthranilate isomerase n=1 Tax=Brevundimonas naejangsanensis TaxID=588932 RepID=UPI00106B7055|nr:phosphoribosylanthranilate isomerase [Brevundimonas naejangsanensis]QBQ49200.1 phosphoribosylanthranilate isomerase [Brevundimonas naejangsanensis]